jgi:hypothetical protein
MDSPAQDIEQLQRQLEIHKTRALHLERIIQGNLYPVSPLQAQFSATSISDMPHSQHGGQDVKAAALARSHSNMGFSTNIGPVVRVSFLSTCFCLLYFLLSPSFSDVQVDRMVQIQDINSSHHALKRQGRALSQQQPTSQSMARAFSNRSEVGMPFRQSGPIAPLTNLSPTISHFGHASSGQESPRLASVAESNSLSGVGIDPSIYIASALGPDGHAPSYLASTGTNLYPHDTLSRQLSSCPSLASGYTLNEGSTPLTRQNSSFGSPVGMSMTRLASTQSRISDEYSSQDSLYSHQSGLPYDISKSAASEHVLLGLGANHPEAIPSKYSSSPGEGNSLFSSPLSVSMDRTESNTSVSSAKSSASNMEQRAKDARFRVLQNSKAALAPKPQQEGNVASIKNEKQTAQVEAKAAPKVGYQRPKHPKVFCSQCNDHPEGFRGDHELRRHINAKHEGIVKKFVCRDPNSVGIPTNVSVRHPLSKCKACISGKQYGAYYNAAAHLRRTHFKPKTARSKNKGANDERRGGKGGGNWPCMSDLKAWFEEVHVAVNQVTSIGDQDQDDEDMGNLGGLDLATDGFPVIEGNMSSYSAVDSNTMSLSEMAESVVNMTTSGMPMVPISSASASYGYTSFPDEAQLSGISNGYAFAEHGAPTYGSAMSANTMATSGFQDMSHISLPEGGWELPE